MPEHLGLTSNWDGSIIWSMPGGLALERGDLEAVLARLGEAWNRHDMSAFASLFAEDADFIDVNGTRFRGRTQIEEVLAARHGTVFRRSRFTRKESSLRFLRPDVAIVHATWELSGAVGPDGIERPPSLGAMTYVVEKTERDWKIAAFQNTPIVGQASFTPR